MYAPPWERPPLSPALDRRAGGRRYGPKVDRGRRYGPKVAGRLGDDQCGKGVKVSMTDVVRSHLNQVFKSVLRAPRSGQVRSGELAVGAALACHSTFTCSILCRSDLQRCAAREPGPEAECPLTSYLRYPRRERGECGDSRHEARGGCSQKAQKHSRRVLVYFASHCDTAMSLTRHC